MSSVNRYEMLLNFVHISFYSKAIQSFIFGHPMYPMSAINFKCKFVRQHKNPQNGSPLIYHNPKNAQSSDHIFNIIINLRHVTISLQTVMFLIMEITKFIM